MTRTRKKSAVPRAVPKAPVQARPVSPKPSGIKPGRNATINDIARLASVSKKWAGFGKEFFTSADNYMLSIDSSVAASDATRILVVAAVMCIDMVLKE